MTSGCYSLRFQGYHTYPGWRDLARRPIRRAGRGRHLSWAKDAVLAQAIREREVAYELGNDPSKCPVKRDLKEQLRRHE